MTAEISQGECAPAEASQLMSASDAAVLAELFKALADPARVRVLAYLAATPGGTVCACHLPDQLGISQPTLSHHLKKLTTAGLVTREQRGRWAHYAVAPAALDGVRRYLDVVSAATGDAAATGSPLASC